MLVTVYKVLYPGLEQVDQYYKWKLEFPEARIVKEDRAGPPRKIRGSTTCPGCGVKVSYQQVYTDQHKCPGTLTDHPVRPRRIKAPRPSQRELDEHWNNYVRDNNHPISFSDDNK